MRLKQICNALILSVCAISGVALAADNSTLEKFARANADKFSNEIIETAGLRTGSRVTIRAALDRVDMIALLPEYDPSNGSIRFTTILSSSHHTVSTKCKPDGRFVGQNAYGAKVNARRETCDRLAIYDGDPQAATLTGIELKMTPTQYREIKKNGLPIEVGFTIGHPKKTVPVEYSDTVDDATLESPVLTRMHLWWVAGQVETISWLMPGDSSPTLVWTRP